MPSPTLPGPVLTCTQLAPQSSERQISSFSPPVPSHTLRASNGSTMIAAPTVPFTASAKSEGGVMFSHMPGSGSASHGSTGPPVVSVASVVSLVAVVASASVVSAGAVVADDACEVAPAVVLVVTGSPSLVASPLSLPPSPELGSPQAARQATNDTTRADSFRIRSAHAASPAIPCRKRTWGAMATIVCASYDRSRMRASVLVCVAALASCHKPPSTATTTSTPAVVDASTPAEVSPLGVIVASLVPIAAGGAAIDIEDAGASIDACEAAGWPATLPIAQARTLPEHGIGTHAIVVHPGGTTMVTVAGIECRAPGDIEGPIASLDLEAAAPEGPPDSRVPADLRDRLPGRPHLAVLGATVASTATLVDPVAIDLARNLAVRDAITRYVDAAIAKRRATCVAQGLGEGMPTEAVVAKALPEAVASAVVHPMRAGTRTLHFAVVQHPSVTFGCQGEEELLGALLDPAGEALLELVSNNGIDLQWITDLDGDGTDEALVDMTWMEDGMHDIGVLHREGETWARAVLWSADTP